MMLRPAVLLTLGQTLKKSIKKLELICQQQQKCNAVIKNIQSKITQKRKGNNQ